MVTTTIMMTMMLTIMVMLMLMTIMMTWWWTWTGLMTKSIHLLVKGMETDHWQLIKDDNGDDRDNDPNDDKVMTEVVTEVTMMRKSSFASWWYLAIPPRGIIFILTLTYGFGFCRSTINNQHHLSEKILFCLLVVGGIRLFLRVVILADRTSFSIPFPWSWWVFTFPQVKELLGMFHIFEHRLMSYFGTFGPFWHTLPNFDQFGIFYTFWYIWTIWSYLGQDFKNLTCSWQLLVWQSSRQADMPDGLPPLTNDLAWQVAWGKIWSKVFRNCPGN